MPIRRRRPHLAWLRLLLLVSLLLVVGGVVALFLFGRAGQTRTRPQVAEDAALATEGTTLIGRDFDYTYTEGQRPLFRIKGDSIRADRGDTLYLDGVGLTLYDPEGRAYQVESKVASFNRTANEGQLEGNVHLQGPSGLDFRSATLQIAEKGRLLLAPQAVEIGFEGKYVARADTLSFRLEEEVYVLAGNAVVRSIPGVRPALLLRSQQLIYERPRRQLRIEGGAVLARGPDQLQAGRMVAFLTEDEKGFSLIRALFEVSGRVAAETAEEGRTRVRFSGKELGVVFEPGADQQARQVELDSDERAGVVLQAVGGGVTRVLTAKRVVGRMAQGLLSSASAFRGVEVRERAGPGVGAERVVSGDRADVIFQPNGQIGTVNLDGGVSYSEPDLNAAGERGQMDFPNGRGELFGSPVDVHSPRGRLLSPHIVYTRADGLLAADGGVRATLEQSEDALGGSLPGAGAGEGPVRVDSRQAFWRNQPRSVLFRGDVRAWRGDSLLTARDLRGDQEGASPQGGKMTASGGVKSYWVPAQTAPKPADKPGDKPAASGSNAKAQPGPRQPIEVTASELVYTRTPGRRAAPARGRAEVPASGVLTYSGDVRVEQEGRTLLCQTLTVELGKDNEAETMTCTGQVHVTDPPAGRDIQGEQAVYHVAERRVEVTGDPVTLRDKDGNQVRGRRLFYFIDDGRVEVKGQGPAAAPSPAPAPPPVTPAVPGPPPAAPGPPPQGFQP